MDSSISKNRDFGERRKTTMMPMRIHEMDLGLPKSAGQPGKTQRSQPVRVGPLVEAMERSTSKAKSSAQRINVAPAGTGNVRRQLYNDTANRTQSDAPITGGLHSCTDKSVKNLINVCSTDKSGAVRLGLSKSDGKVKLNDQKSQPIRVKHLMESWEKSQTAKRAVQKSVTGRLRSVNVRRKLYSVVPSPVALHKVTKNLLASEKPQETSDASQKMEKKNNKKNADVSKNSVGIQNIKRKSFLLPPNSIRDKHITLKTNDTIMEQSTTSLSPEQEIKVASAADLHQTADLPEAETLPDALKSVVESVVTSSSQNSEKLLESNIEITRPSVIMGLATSTASKTRNQSASSECSSNRGFALSHPPLDELLNKNSTMPEHRLDAANTSLEDLLGNSEKNRQESSRTSNLPYNSFLRICENSEQSMAQLDRQTLSWFHGNMQLSIQTMEENIFTMKKMLKTIEDIMSSSEPIDNSSNEKNTNNVPAENPKIIVDGVNYEVMEDELKENGLSPLSFAHEDEIIEEIPREINNEENIAEENKENFFTIDNDNEERKMEVESEKPLSFAHEDEIIEDVPRENNEENFAEENKENFLTMNNENEDRNKEVKRDKKPRRSSRLAAIEALSNNKNPDDSFSRIEKELNITHDKSKSGTPDKCTPVKRKTVDPRSRRSIREYMALKSCAKFLQTPDHKGLPTPNYERIGTPAQRRAAERALSVRVLNQLHDLYDESPE